MALSVRDVGIEMVSYLGDESTMDGNLPVGARTFMLNCVNAALERMRAECPQLFKQTLGFQWTQAVSGTVNATSGSEVVTLGTLPAPDDGCTIKIGGVTNEIRASVTEDGSYLLLHPYTGSSGLVECTVYGDSVLLDADVDTVLSVAMDRGRRRWLDILGSREEWVRVGSLCSSFDYGGSADGNIGERQPGLPRGVWVESFADQAGGPIRYRARVAPLPNADYRATMEIVPVMREAEDEDFNLGADTFLPVPANRYHTIFRPLVLYAWFRSPWVKVVPEVRKAINEEYASAIPRMEALKAHANAPFRTEIWP